MEQVDRWERLSLERLRRGPPPSALGEQEALNEAARAVAREHDWPALPLAPLMAGAAALDAAAGFAGLGLAGAGPAPALVAAGALVAMLAALGRYRLAALARFRSAMLWAGGLAVALAAAGGAAGVWPAEAARAAAPYLLGAFGLLRGLAAPLCRWLIDSRATSRRAVIVGGGGNAEKLVRGLAANPDSDIRIVGLFDDRADDRSPPVVAGVRKLGRVGELVAFARIARIDMLIVTLPLSAETRILSLLRTLWVLPIDVRLSAYSEDFAFPRGASGLIGVRDHPLADWRRAAKRALDIVGASAALIALSPVMLLTALAIRLESPGPILFRQPRHGYNHRPVEVLKFRSMRAETCDPLARSIVTRHDPRVTRVGRFIRRTSIDELPQLFNVLSGRLSLVGPRPHAVVAKSSREELFSEIVEGYSGRHRMPPGITGWAQIHGWRGEIDDPEKLRQRFEHDLYYIENWSLWLDLKILLRTPLSLLDARAAY